ncbi:MAG: hypothetical protein AAF598_13595 [Bacteroidota bacterium]
MNVLLYLSILLPIGLLSTVLADLAILPMLLLSRWVEKNGSLHWTALAFFPMLALRLINIYFTLVGMALCVHFAHQYLSNWVVYGIGLSLAAGWFIFLRMIKGGYFNGASASGPLASISTWWRSKVHLEQEEQKSQRNFQLSFRLMCILIMGIFLLLAASADIRALLMWTIRP